MGLMDSLEQMLASKLGAQAGGGSLLGPIMNMLHPRGGTAATQNMPGGQGGALGGLASIGGLAGLIKMFQNRGLSDIINSWIGSGPNKPVTTDQLQEVLGDQHVNELARQMGTDPDQALSHLQHVLPNLIDKLTPNGQIPSEQELLKHFSQAGQPAMA